MRIIELNVETYKCVQSEKHFNVDAAVNQCKWLYSRITRI